MKLNEKQIEKIYKHVDLGNKQIVMLEINGDFLVIMGQRV
jgi:hypothetical protein